MASLPNCQNCGHPVDLQYCPQCGQKNPIRFTWTYIYHEITSAFDFERGLLLTFRDFTINPGATAGNYINGEIRNYYHPVKYSLLGFSLLQLVSIYNPDFSKYYGNFTVESIIAASLLYFIGALFTLSMSSYLLFGKPRYNLVQHVVVWLYWVGHAQFFAVILVVAGYFFIPEVGQVLLSGVFPLLGIVYSVWMLWKIFEYRTVPRLTRTVLFLVIQGFYVVLSSYASSYFLPIIYN